MILVHGVEHEGARWIRVGNVGQFGKAEVADEFAGSVIVSRNEAENDRGLQLPKRVGENVPEPFPRDRSSNGDIRDDGGAVKVVVERARHERASPLQANTRRTRAVMSRAVRFHPEANTLWVLINESDHALRYGYGAVGGTAFSFTQSYAQPVFAQQFVAQSYVAPIRQQVVVRRPVVVRERVIVRRPFYGGLRVRAPFVAVGF